MLPTLIVATRNAHKLAELTSLLAPEPIQIVSVRDFAEVPQVVEDCDSLEANALKKAADTAHHLRQGRVKTPFVVLADDSGLEVEALGGAPGVFSARFAEFDGAFPDKPLSAATSARNVTCHDNNMKLLRLMANVPEENRAARFRCVIALVTSDGRTALAEGVCRGTILREERGAHGFGYDPLFVPDGYDKTFAELGREIKDLVSHRARAMKRAKEILRNL
jgi:XTP/dITP diphosphohydrolase